MEEAATKIQRFYRDKSQKKKEKEPKESKVKEEQKDGDVEVVVVVEDGLIHKVVGVKDTSDNKVKEASKVINKQKSLK